MWAWEKWVDRISFNSCHVICCFVFGVLETHESYVLLLWDWKRVSSLTWRGDWCVRGRNASQSKSEKRKEEHSSIFNPLKFLDACLLFPRICPCYIVLHSILFVHRLCFFLSPPSSRKPTTTTVSWERSEFRTWIVVDLQQETGDVLSSFKPVIEPYWILKKRREKRILSRLLQPLKPPENCSIYCLHLVASTLIYYSLYVEWGALVLFVLW